MRYNPRRTLLVTVPLLIGLTVATAAATWPAKTPSAAGEFAAAEAWVAAHRNALPATLAQLAALPQEHRNLIVSELDPEARRAVWREQLEAYALPDSQLSPVQRQMVRDLGVTLNVDELSVIRLALDSIGILFDPAQSHAKRAAVANRLCAYGKKAFRNNHVQYVVFHDLGPADSAHIHLRNRIATAYKSSQASVFPDFSDFVRRAAIKIGVRRDGECVCAQQSVCDCAAGVFCSAGSGGGCSSSKSNLRLLRHLSVQRLLQRHLRRN